MTGTVLLVVNLLSQAAPQSTAEQLRFEVASIRPHTEAGSARTGFEDNPSVVRFENLSLRALIRIAYGVMDAQLAGPGWLNDPRFDIVAKPPAGYQPGQLPVLVRNLLIDRFGLMVHREMREVPGFALRVSAGGHRLIESTGERTFLTGRPGLISGNKRSMAELVSLVAQMVSAPVLDETGLRGAYDLKLQWTPQLSAPAAASSVEPELSIFTALREQMGLRLDSVRTRVEVVTVDAVEKTPTEN